MALGKVLGTIAGGALVNKNVRNAVFGKGGKMKQVGNLSPEQQQLMELITEGLTTGEGSLGGLFGDFDKESFESGVTKPAIKQFQEEILPMLQEKFISGNQVQGSGMRRAQMRAGTDLQEKLAALTYQAQQQQQQNKLSGLQTALGTRAIENVYKPGTQGLLGGVAQGAGPAFGKYIAG